MADQDLTLLEKTIDELLEDHPPAGTGPIEFLRAQFDIGLAYVWFPPGYGGLELPIDLQNVVDARLSEAGAPPVDASPTP